MSLNALGNEQAIVKSSPVIREGALHFDSALGAAKLDPANGALVAQATNTQTVANNSAPNPLMPDVWAYGIGTGAGIPQPFKGSVWILSPTGNPLDFSSADGSPSNTIFAAKPLSKVHQLTPTNIFMHGGVATWNPERNYWEIGIGGTFGINAGGVPIVAWINARGGERDFRNFTGTISANFGAAISVDQAAAKALAGLAFVSAAIPTPPTTAAAGGLAKASAALTAGGQGANVFAGGGYRVEVKITNGKIDGIYYKGQKIPDLNQFALDIARNSRRYSPPVIPNQGIPAIANYNSTVQQIFGTSPWDLATVSGGKNHGNGAVAVANAWRSTIQTYGQQYYNQLPNAIKSIVVFGPRSMSDAGAAVNAILSVADPQTANQIVSRLENRYNLDFGVPAVKVANEFDIIQEPRPGDYEFVRNVFEGDYRYFEDNPQNNARPLL
jgi:hypothetical protein